MRYRLYIYNTIAETENAPEVNMVNNIISAEQNATWKYNQATKYMQEFNAEDIKKAIEQVLCGKCRVVAKYLPKEEGQVEYLYISTSFERIREVLTKVHAIASANDLVLYDKERNCRVCVDVVDESFVSMKLREREIRDCIYDADRKIWDYKKISSCEDGRHKSCSLVVTLRKIKGVPFEERVVRFYNMLKNSLKGNEVIDCEDECFNVIGAGYSICIAWRHIRNMRIC